MLAMRGQATMVTALFGIFDPRTLMFTYASAGHCTPLLATPDGRVNPLPHGGVPLGIFDEIELEDWTFSLVPGSMLVLYTDGLIEYSRDLSAGEEILHSTIGALMFEWPENPAKAVQERVFSDVANTDDVATLTLSVAPQHDAAFDFTFSAIPFSAPLARRTLQSYLVSNGVDDDGVFRITSATGEAVANAIEHAYAGTRGTVRIRATIDNKQVLLNIEDSGRWRATKHQEERGRGIPLMRALMDGVEIRSDRTSTKVKLRLERA
jgi:anti-sigma regulatory factor (Ser/Thr protein kinase)